MEKKIKIETTSTQPDLFNLKQEDKIFKCYEKSFEIKNRLKKFTSTEIEGAKEIVNYQRNILFKEWPALFKGFKPKYIYVHVDLDAFYASCEILKNPNYANIPIGIGTSLMLATTNYKAREFGVKAGMPGYIGKRLCPQLTIVSPNFARYNYYSDLVMNIISHFDPEIEIYGIDEACLVFNKEKLQKAFETWNTNHTVGRSPMEPSVKFLHRDNDFNVPHGVISSHVESLNTDFEKISKNTKLITKNNNFISEEATFDIDKSNLSINKLKEDFSYSNLIQCSPTNLQKECNYIENETFKPIFSHLSQKIVGTKNFNSKNSYKDAKNLVNKSNTKNALSYDTNYFAGLKFNNKANHDSNSKKVEYLKIEKRYIENKKIKKSLEIFKSYHEDTNCKIVEQESKLIKETDTNMFKNNIQNNLEITTHDDNNNRIETGEILKFNKPSVNNMIFCNSNKHDNNKIHEEMQKVPCEISLTKKNHFKKYYSFVFDGNLNFKNIEWIVNRIRESVYRNTGLTISAGISVCRGLAKFGSDINKPNGQFTIKENFDKHILDLKVDEINGIGKYTKEMLLRTLGIHTVRDLRENMHLLNLILKEKTFLHLLRLSYGLSIFDRRNIVQSLGATKSKAKDVTFPATDDYKFMLDVMWDASFDISSDLKRFKHFGNVVTLKIRYIDFESHTVQKKLKKPIQDQIDIFIEALELFCRIFCKGDNINPIYKTFNTTNKINLLGIRVSDLTSSACLNPIYKFRGDSKNVGSRTCPICNKEFFTEQQSCVETHVEKCMQKMNEKKRKFKGTLFYYFEGNKKPLNK
ncbi:hypothetical protein EDEG_00699 [Edhazardia aedis USNM 41457]|uniref:UmuC domain-containing protein n=1 Tax=Edhazardia aedis (strain USNM 41457) TaxID=1003232 RepID=J9DCP3_EDHAE|nr:hypothetical protein EDEG_00699 [Edhazardia aedis USNM 41457]|eukprot:EJW05234.1 hypothetical protein EDEG_00699 [Edhazardia aedis USNM 41457]